MAWCCFHLLLSCCCCLWFDLRLAMTWITWVISERFVLSMCIACWVGGVVNCCAVLLVTVFVTVVACFVFGYVRCV